MIQGPVSLEDETVEDGRTELVLRFQHHLEEWWCKVPSHNGSVHAPSRTKGLIHKIGKLWTPDGAEVCGIFVCVRCVSYKGRYKLRSPRYHMSQRGRQGPDAKGNNGSHGEKNEEMEWL